MSMSRQQIFVLKLVFLQFWHLQELNKEKNWVQVVPTSHGYVEGLQGPLASGKGHHRNSAPISPSITIFFLFI